MISKTPKTMRNVLLPLLVVAGLAGAACGESVEVARAAGQPAAEQPWGRDFLSTAVTENGESRPLVDGTRIRLSFGDDGSSFEADAGCNQMGGTATIEDGHLVVADGLVTTEMACEPDRMDQDSWLADFLTGRPAFSLTGPDMTLTRDGTEIRLSDREVADPDRPLRGTKWVVDGIVDGDAVSSVPAGAEAFVIFSEENEEEFGGNTGCNSMGGTAVVGEESIAFSEVITTKIACDGDRDKLEKAVLAVLDGDVAYDIDADRLTLNHPSGDGLMLRAAG